MRVAAGHPALILHGNVIHSVYSEKHTDCPLYEIDIDLRTHSERFNYNDTKLLLNSFDILMNRLDNVIVAEDVSRSHDDMNKEYFDKMAVVGLKNATENNIIYEMNSMIQNNEIKLLTNILDKYYNVFNHINNNHNIDSKNNIIRQVFHFAVKYSNIEVMQLLYDKLYMNYDFVTFTNIVHDKNDDSYSYGKKKKKN